MSATWYPMLGVVTITTGTNDAMIFDEGGGDLTATLAAGDYYLTPTTAPRSLLAAIVAALNAAGGKTWTAALALDVNAANPSAVVTITASAGSCTLQFSDVLTTFDETLLGYAAGVDVGPGTSFASTLSPTCLWLADQPPISDDPDFPATARQTRSTSGVARTLERGAHEDRAIAFDMVAAARSLQEANAADPAASWEAFWRVHRDGRQLQVHRVAVSSGTALAQLSTVTLLRTVVLRQDTLDGYSPRRMDPGVALYGWTAGLRVTQPAAAPALLAWWPCNEVAATDDLLDAMGTYDLTPTSAPAVASSLWSEAPSGLRSFDGAADYFSAAADAAAVAQFVANYSVTLLFAPGDVATTQWLFALTGDTTLETETTNILQSLTIRSTGEMGWFWETGSGTNVSANTTGAPLVADHVYFVGLVVSAASSGAAASCNVDLYLYDSTDDVWFHQQWQNQTRATGGDAAPVWIVGETDTATAPYAGDVEDVRVATTAMTADQMHQLALEYFG